MTHTLLFSFVSFTFLVSWLIWTRTRNERAVQQLAELEVEAAERGLLEDA